MRTIVYAPNVHVGGGFILLKELILSVAEDKNIVFILDERAKAKLQEFESPAIFWFPHSISGRLRSELFLKRISSNDDIVLCFHNVPPLFKCKGKIKVFLQNRLIVDSSLDRSMTQIFALRVYLDRLLLLCRFNFVDEYIVQTESMKNKLIDLNRKYDCNIRVVPFSKKMSTCDFFPQIKEDNKYYIYVASNEEHKNHHGLVEAWSILLNNFGISERLIVTLSENELISIMSKFSENNTEMLRVEAIGNVSHEELLRLLKSSKALIFPSRMESFGLPLIEAEALNVPIIASELDYVRDVCTPRETFDCNSPLSIARAIARFEGKERAPIGLSVAKDFFEIIKE